MTILELLNARPWFSTLWLIIAGTTIVGCFEALGRRRRCARCEAVGRPAE